MELLQGDRYFLEVAGSQHVLDLEDSRIEKSLKSEFFIGIVDFWTYAKIRKYFVYAIFVFSR
jgi:hypothetical protein